MVPAARWIQRHVRSALPLSSAGLPTSLLLYRMIGGHEVFCPGVFELPEGTGGIVLAASMREAVTFVNEYAPEHLEVQVREPFALLPELKTPAKSCSDCIHPSAQATTVRWD